MSMEMKRGFYIFCGKFKKNSNLIFPSISNFPKSNYYVDHLDIILWIIVETYRSRRLSIAEVPQRVCQRLKLINSWESLVMTLHMKEPYRGPQYVVQIDQYPYHLPQSLDGLS